MGDPTGAGGHGHNPGGLAYYLNIKLNFDYWMPSLCFRRRDAQQGVPQSH